MDCVVCAELLESSVSACIPCGHVFHLDCLGTWLTEHRNCPMCRKNYELTDMQILYLPKDETNLEIANADEEVKKKWEIYTISDKLKEERIQDQSHQAEDAIITRVLSQSVVRSQPSHNRAGSSVIIIPSRVQPSNNSYLRELEEDGGGSRRRRKKKRPNWFALIFVIVVCIVTFSAALANQDS